jgi:hypothetical protein
MPGCCDFGSQLSRRLLFSQDGLCWIYLVGHSKINSLKMFIVIETLNQLITFQYNDFKTFNWENT